MKAAATLLALLLPVVSARFVTDGEPNLVNLQPADEAGAVELYLIETAPGETSWVTEEQKWELRRNGQRFFDITDSASRDQPLRAASDKKSVFPKKVTLQDEVNPLLKNLSQSNLQEHLEKFTSFHTRYYKSEYGKQSSAWLLKTIQDTIKHADGYKHGVEAVAFEHPWGQSSIIARIPGKTNSTVVIAAHQDSINLWLPSVLAAPGADDDGSGTVTILEAFRAILLSDYVLKGEGLNTLEFHWYSAEEGGLLGSQAVFEEYAATGRDVKAMLQQDMTGFVQRTLEAGKPESLGIMVDFVDPNLTEFIKKVIVAYTELPFVETKCGYACSDHASALKVGYPSACVTESAFEYTDNHIHTVDDRISYLSFSHMLQHARMTVGFVYELAFTDFKKLEAESDGLPEMPEDEKIIDL